MTIEKKIMIVEDSGAIAIDIESTLIKLGFSVCSNASSGEHAIEMIQKETPDLILMDIKLTGKKDGIDTAIDIKKHADIPVIYMTAHKDKELVQRAKLTRPYGYILKPFDEINLYSAIELALYTHNIEKELQDKETKLEREKLEREQTQEALSDSETMFKTLYESSKDAIVLVDDDYNVLRCNHACLRMFGYQSIEEFRTEKAVSSFAANQLQEIDSTSVYNKLIAKAKQDGSSSFEWGYQRQDASEFLSEVVITSVTINEKILYQFLIRDITERKAMEEQLEQYRIRLEDLVTKRTIELSKTVKQLQLEIKEREDIEKELEDQQKQLEKLVTARTVQLQDTVSHLLKEIDDRKEAERALSANEARFRTLVQNINEYVYSIEYQHEQPYSSYHSRKCLEITGYSPEEFYQDPRLGINMIHPEDGQTYQQLLTEAIESTEAFTIEHRIFHKDGHIRWISNTLSLTTDESGQLRRLDGFILDITERKTFENNLLNLNRHLNILTKCSNVVIYAKNEPTLLENICDTIIQTSNYKIMWIGLCESYDSKIVVPVTQTGLDGVFLNDLRISYEEDTEGSNPIALALSSGNSIVSKPSDLDNRIKPWDEQAFQPDYSSCLTFPLIHQKIALGVMNIYSANPEAFHENEIILFEELARDLTFGIISLRRLEQRNLAEKELREALKQLQTTQDNLVQAEKMAFLAKLVAGVAHEINTPIGISVSSASFLTYITGNIIEAFAQRTARKSDMDNYFEKAKESSELILNNLMRTKEIIDNFKMLSVDHVTLEKRVFHLRSYLEGILLSLKPKLRNYSHEVLIVCPDNLKIKTFPGALYQVITNFIMNSISHAYNEEDEGIIVIQVIKKADHIVLEYRDNGRGISQENLGRIFDPFFTTKRGSENTGLGLHIVFNIVNQTLKGTIECQSEEKGVSADHGSRFIIKIPLS